MNSISNNGIRKVSTASLGEDFIMTRSRSEISDSSVLNHEITPTSNERFIMADFNPNLRKNQGLDDDVKNFLSSPLEHAHHTSIPKVLLGATAGIGLGILLSQLKVNEEIVEWVSLPGDLFIRALQCLIVPLVFCSVVSGVADLVEAKKAFGIGTRTVTYFLVASFTSSTVGTLFGLLFMGLFAEQMEEQEINATPQLTFQCLNGKFLTLMRSGDVICLANNDTAPATIFNISDSSNYFALSTTKYQRLTISDQITGILYDLVPSNIANAVSNGTVLSVISFAILFGVAVVKSFNEKTEKVNYALLLVTQCNIILQMLISFVIQFIPLAIISLIGGSLATNYDSSTELFASIGFLILALGVALGILVFFIMGGALFVTTRRNIFSYLRYMIPAQVFIMGCSSSIATLPMTMRCVDSTHEVSRSLSRFVLSLGASSNLNGTAVYMPLACIFMAKVSGLQDQLTTVKIILLIIVGAIASYGVAPVPHAGLVMVITVWRTVFGADVPSAFSILVGMDWILNRMRAIVNITNDTIIVRIIAGQCDETINYSIENDNHEYGFVLNTPPTFPESPVTESLNHHRSQTMREV